MDKELSGNAVICNALHKVMEAVGYVQKGSKNQFHKYNYASEAELLKALRPAMVREGLMLIPSQVLHSPIDDYGNITVTMEYTLCHSSGAVWPEKIRALGCGNDKNSKGGVGDKGLYKAITGANKYLLFKLFQIETGDDPEATDNGDTATKDEKRKKSPKNDKLPHGESATEEQNDKIRELKEKSGFPWKVIRELAWNTVGEELEQLSKGSASEVIKALEAMIADMPQDKDETPFE